MITAEEFQPLLSFLESLSEVIKRSDPITIYHMKDCFYINPGFPDDGHGWTTDIIPL